MMDTAAEGTVDWPGERSVCGGSPGGTDER